MNQSNTKTRDRSADICVRQLGLRKFLADKNVRAPMKRVPGIGPNPLPAAVLVRWLAVGFVALFAPARATDYPVSTVAQINAALATAQPGDTITLTNKVWQDADILFKQNGTPANPITLRAQTPGEVILAGTSRLRIAGHWLVVEGLRFQFGAVYDSEVIRFRENSSRLATNCVLTDCSIVDYSPALPPDESTDYKWISLYGASNRVENCYFKGKTNAGTTLVVWLPGPTNASNHHIIRRNYFGPRPDLGVNGGETIRIGTSDRSFTSSQTVVEANYFLACNGETEIISNKSCDNVYRYNTFDSCAGALTFRHGNRCTAEGNWFLGRGLPLTGGVRIIGEDHRVFNNYFVDLMGTGYRSALTFMLGVPDSALNEYWQVQRAEVAFNTFVNCRVSMLIGMAHSTLNTTLPPLDCVIANNIVWSSNAPLIEQRVAPINMAWEGNLMHGASLGITPPAGITLVNPQLALAADGLWRPATNSPALGGAAGSYPSVVNDMDGQPRTGAKDIGSDQASAAPVTRRPLGPADVGPSWMRSMGAIQSVESVGNAVMLTWDSLPGLTYQVQYSSNAVNWTSVSQTVSNMSNTSSWTDDGSLTGGAPDTQTSRFYRIALTP